MISKRKYLELKKRMIKHQVIGDIAFVVLSARELQELLECVKENFKNPICYSCKDVATFGYKLSDDVVCEKHRYSFGNDSVPLDNSMWKAQNTLEEEDQK